MDSMFPFARGDVFPSWWANAIQRFISTGAPSFRLRRVTTTTIEVPAGAGEDAAVIAVDGRWRWNEATVSRAHPGGGAGTYRVWVTAVQNDIVNTPEPGTDQTVYAFALAITAVTAEPTFVAGSVEVWRLVGTVEWSGSAITRVDQTDPPSPSHAYSHAAGGDDPVTAGSVGAVSLPPGSTSGLVPVTDANGVVTWQRAGAASLADGAVSNVAVAAGAAIAESKLTLASDAAAATPSRRSLGTGSTQAAPGNDARFPAGTGIVNADIATTAAIAEAKLTLASDAAAATPSRRSLGTGAAQALPGNHISVTNERVPTDDSISWVKTGTGNQGLADQAFGVFRGTDYAAGAGSVVMFDTSIYSNGASFNAGRFTCARAGLYEFTATIAFPGNASDIYYAKLWIAGDPMDSDNTSEFLHLHGARSMSVGAEAYVILDWAASVRGGRSLTHFNGRMIGR